jgi:hypothetical protein
VSSSAIQLDMAAHRLPMLLAIHRRLVASLVEQPISQFIVT